MPGVSLFSPTEPQMSEKTEQYFRIIGLPGLNGLLVQTEFSRHRDDELIDVEALITDAIIGDRSVKYPLPKDALFVSRRYLEPIPNPEEREYSTENPFGTAKYEGHLVRGKIHIDYVEYDKAITVTIREDVGMGKMRTVISQNYFAKREQALILVEGVTHGCGDVEDLVFALRDLQTAEQGIID